VPSSPDDNSSSSSLFALAAGDGEREAVPWFLCLSVDCRHFDKAPMRGDPSERVIYLGAMCREILKLLPNGVNKPTCHQPIELLGHPSGKWTRHPKRPDTLPFVH